ncbi:sensor histidine kinase [Megalodesulfovibrio paquesii]
MLALGLFSSSGQAPPNPQQLLRLGRLATAGLALLGGLLWLLGLSAAGVGFLAAASTLAVAGAWWMQRSLARSLAHVQNLDKALLQSQKMAEIGQLASGVAHEINNPLAIIGQEAELSLLLLGEENPSGHGADIRDSLRQICQQVARGGEITRKLLDFSRPREAFVQSWELNRLVEDMVLLVERDERLLDVEVLRSYDPELTTLRTDGPLLRQVLLNLLNNAAQAVQAAQAAQEHSPRRGRIMVTTACVGGRVEIGVRDSGQGIAPEHLDKIFTPFFTTKAPGQGTGLGLALCKRMVESLGGVIRVASLPGLGATFTIELPLDPVRVAGPQPPASVSI